MNNHILESVPFVVGGQLPFIETECLLCADSLLGLYILLIMQTIQKAIMITFTLHTKELKFSVHKQPKVT